MDSAHPKYLLDTNAVSHLLSGRPQAVRKRVERVSFDATCISTVTEAELRYGLAKKPGAIKERIAVEAYLANTAILGWDSAAAQALRSIESGTGKKGVSAQRRGPDDRSPCAVVGACAGNQRSCFFLRRWPSHRGLDDWLNLVRSRGTL